MIIFTSLFFHFHWTIYYDEQGVIFAGICINQRYFLTSMEYNVKARQLCSITFFDSHISPLTNISPPCNLKNVVVHTGILIKFRPIVQPYFTKVILTFIFTFDLYFLLLKKTKQTHISDQKPTLKCLPAWSQTLYYITTITLKPKVLAGYLCSLVLWDHPINLWQIGNIKTQCKIWLALLKEGMGSTVV